MGNRKNLIRVMALFFAFIFSFTMLSRASYQYGTAVVTVSRPENRVISHQVVATGKVTQNQELAVVTEPDQRVTAIYVKEGQQVKKGDLLFEIDGKLLEEKILMQQQEMEKQKLQVQDAKSQKSVSAMQKANEQAQAQENYALNTKDASVRLARAKRDLQEAKQTLKDFRQNSKDQVQDSGVEEMLESAFQTKQEAYIQARQELTELQWQIEKAVDDAKKQAVDTTAILMADLAKGYSFEAEITKEQEKYIGTGDLVTLTSGNKKIKLEEQPVSSVRSEEEKEDTYRVTVELPPDSFEIGMAVTMEFVRKSPSYACCVPLSALHLDERNQTYVLTAEEYESVMGTELRARKVKVTVVEQNESYAALAEGSLTSRQQIIIHSDKLVGEGSRIRIEG